MENPYYELIALIRAQAGQAGAGLFLATLRVSEEEGTAVLVEEQPLGEAVWLPEGLSVAEEDDGRAVACLPFDRGFLILTKLNPL